MGLSKGRRILTSLSVKSALSLFSVLFGLRIPARPHIVGTFGVQGGKEEAQLVIMGPYLMLYFQTNPFPLQPLLIGMESQRGRTGLLLLP